MPVRRDLPLKVWLLFGLLLGVPSIWHGLLLLRGSRIDPCSVEHTRSLGWINIINFVLRRPRQERLRALQMQAFGWVYVAFGVLVIAVPAVVLLVRALQG